MGLALEILVKLAIVATLGAPRAMALIDCSNCLDAIYRVSPVKSPAEVLATKSRQAEEAIGRPISLKLKKGLEEALSVPANPELYTPAEVIKQNQILKKFGYSEEDIAALRRKHVLANSVIETAEGAPTGVEILKLSMQRMTSKDLDTVRKGKKLYYIVGQDETLYVSETLPKLPTDKIAVVVSKNSEAAASGTSTLIRESGEVVFDEVRQTYAFRPKYGFDTSKAEMREVLDNVSAVSPGLRTAYEANSAVSHSQVIKCLDILSAQSKGKNFVLDRFITDNMVTTGAILVNEARGDGRLDTDEGRRVVAADIIGGNIATTFGSIVGKHLVLTNATLSMSMAMRTGLGMGMVEMQKGVHDAVLEGNTENSTAEDIAAFNRLHFMARLPINHYLDEFFIKTLPHMIFNSCQRSPTMSVLVSPRSIRLFERYASATIYYGLRNNIVGH